MPSINLGRVRFNPRGEYVEEVPYVLFDIVSHEGSSYLCKANVEGLAPTDEGAGNYWQVLAKGLDAESIEVTTETGKQTLADALDSRAISGNLGNEIIKVGEFDRTLLSFLSDYVTPEDFGGLPGEENDATEAIKAAMLSGKPVYLGDKSKVWHVSKMLLLTLTSPLHILSHGSSIVMESSQPVHRLISVDQAGHPVSINGDLTLDGRRNAFQGLYLVNPLSTNRTSIKISGLTVQNIRRSSQTYSGGDGIWIQGAYDIVSLKHFIVENISMAEGAVIAGAQGICGVTVTRDNANATDAHLIHIEDFIIRNILSDANEFIDQDGIRVFQSYNDGGAIPSTGYAVIRNGQIKDSKGRSIKLQTEFADIENMKLIRTAACYVPGNGTRDIDYQTGGGNIRNIHFQHESAAPMELIRFTPSRGAGRLNPQAMVIEGITYTRYGGGQNLSQYFTMNLPDDVGNFSNLSIKGVYDHGNKNVDNCFLNISGLSTLYTIDIDSVWCRVASNKYLVKNNNVPYVFLNAKGVNCSNHIGLIENLAEGSVVEKALLGVNRRVSSV